MEVVRDVSTDHLVRWPADGPGKQSAACIVVKSLDKKKSFLKRVVDMGLSFERWRRATNGAQCGHVQTTLELLGAEKAQ